MEIEEGGTQWLLHMRVNGVAKFADSFGDAFPAGAVLDERERGLSAGRGKKKSADLRHECVAQLFCVFLDAISGRRGEGRCVLCQRRMGTVPDCPYICKTATRISVSLLPGFSDCISCLSPSDAHLPLPLFNACTSALEAEWSAANNALDALRSASCTFMQSIKP
jgi:hypothetical protein